MVKWISYLMLCVLCPFLAASPVNPSHIDFNSDLIIDVEDLFSFSPAWLSHDGPSDDWNPDCDLSIPPDEVINQADLVEFLDDWLLSIPGPEDYINPADINNDHKVNILDYSIFSAAWLSDDTSANWNPSCDISDPNDNVVDVNDLMVLVSNWLVKVPYPIEYIRPADINDDLIINLPDYSIFSAAWLSDETSANWNPSCDISNPIDGVVDINDLSVLVSNWLEILPDPNKYIDVPDLNDDRIVDYLDYDIFANAWLSDSKPMPNWNAAYDLADSGDGIIDAMDLAVIAAHWQFRIPDPNEFIYIPGGTFLMGDHHEAMPSASPVHLVNMDSYYMGKYQVTNGLYCDYLNDAVMAGDIKVVQGIVYHINDESNDYPYFDTNLANSYSQIDFINGIFSVRSKDNIEMSNYPLIEVSWYGAAAYCNWRSHQDGYSSCYDLSTWDCNFSARGYRLPTEAQWEYAARGGQYTPYYRYPWGDEIDISKANYWLLGRTEPIYTVSHPVLTPVGYYDGNQRPSGQDMVNGWGLYDMAGNVLEWCNDRYDINYYKSLPQDNPTGPTVGESRVTRGGSWNNEAIRCRVAYREDDHFPEERSGSYGFRVVFGPLPMPN